MSARAPHRRGFTLLELLLVLALIVTVAAMAAPAFRSTMVRQRLRKGAESVRVEMTRARVRAMNTGMTQALYLGSTNGELLTVPYAPNMEELSDQQQANYQNEQAAVTAIQSGQELPEGTGKRLPEGVSFTDNYVTDDPSLSSSSGQTVNATGVGGAMMSVPILFYVDGSASTARVIVGNERGDSVTVSLRGLTGAIKVSRVSASGVTQ